MKSLENKWLIVRDSVKLTEHIDPVINALDSFFESFKLKSYVTSGLRTPEDQLRIIRSALVANRLADDYPEAFLGMDTRIPYHFDEIREIYGWQMGWSKLLSIGYIVNPPHDAIVLMDYIRPGSKENKKGKMIYQSPHTRGTAFDIGGGKDGVDNELEVIKAATGKIKGLRGYLLERNNNAIHVDVKPINL